MAFKMKSGNKVSFKNMGSSPARNMKDGSYEHSFESPAKQKKVDPDAPGTPGKPGYEPPVKRSDLDGKGKAIWDRKRKRTDTEKEQKREKRRKEIEEGMLNPVDPTKRNYDRKRKEKSPAKQYQYSESVDKNIKTQGKKDKASNAAKKDASILAGDTDAIVTNQSLKEGNKKNKQNQRSADSPGGRLRTIKERREATDTRLAAKGDQATKQEARGEGKRGFSWRNAGMAALEGKGLMGAVRSGIGQGEYKSTKIKRKQEKRAGTAERKVIKKTQAATRKENRVAKRTARSNKVRKASDLNTGV